MKDASIHQTADRAPSTTIDKRNDPSQGNPRGQYSSMQGTQENQPRQLLSQEKTGQWKMQAGIQIRADVFKKRVQSAAKQKGMMESNAKRNSLAMMMMMMMMMMGTLEFSFGIMDWLWYCHQSMLGLDVAKRGSVVRSEVFARLLGDQLVRTYLIRN